MEYFILKQEVSLDCYPKIKDTFMIEKIWEDKSALYLPVQSYLNKIGFCSLPLITTPSFIISHELKNIFEAFQFGGMFRTVVLDNSEGDAELYSFYQPPILDCISEKTEFNNGKTVKKLVLDQNKIGAHKVFQVARILEKYLVVDFETLESILCSGIFPFRYEKVIID